MSAVTEIFQGPHTTVDQGQIKQNADNLTTLQNVQNDPNVDPVTKRDIASGLAKSSNSLGGTNFSKIDDLLNVLSQSKSGTGIYAVRKINDAQKNLLASYPGRQQLSPGLGQGSAKLGSFF